MRNSLYNFIGTIIVFSLVLNSSHAQESRPVARADSVENIRGLVKPRHRAALFSEISGRIIDIRYLAGQRFKKGELLIKFDCALYEADLASARAKYEADIKQFENNKKLLELNAISDIEVELSSARMHMSEAEASIKSIVSKNCQIIAPYSGRVIDVKANLYESVVAGQELISILDDQYLDIDLIVPSSWLNTLDEGVEFTFLVDETRKKYSAHILQIGAIVDPVSQTVRLTGEFTGNIDDVLSGMSGTAYFDLIKQ